MKPIAQNITILKRDHTNKNYPHVQQLSNYKTSQKTHFVVEVYFACGRHERPAATGMSPVEFQAKSNFTAKLRLIMRKVIPVKKFSIVAQ